MNAEFDDLLTELSVKEQNVVSIPTFQQTNDEFDDLVTQLSEEERREALQQNGEEEYHDGGEVDEEADDGEITYEQWVKMFQSGTLKDMVKESPRSASPGPSPATATTAVTPTPTVAPSKPSNGVADERATRVIEHPSAVLPPTSGPMKDNDSDDEMTEEEAREMFNYIEEQKKKGKQLYCLPPYSSEIDDKLNLQKQFFLLFRFVICDIRFTYVCRSGS